MGNLADSEIIKQIIEALGINPNILSTKLGYKSHASVYHVVNGLAKLSPGMMDRIVRTFPNVNYNFMTNQELPILLDEQGTISQANIMNIPLSKEDNMDIFKIKQFLDLPEQLNRIEEKLDMLLNSKDYEEQ